MRQLRPYQIAALEATRSQLRQYASTVVVLPTGLGKTVFAAKLIAEWEHGNCLFLAHTRELIEQAADKLGAELGYRPGVEMNVQGVELNTLWQGGMSVVGSVQTMYGDRRLAKYAKHPFGMIVIDECHHSTAATYTKVVDYFRGLNPNVKVVGITATPNRADGTALGLMFESVAYQMSINQAVEDGWLVRPEQESVFVEALDFDGIKTRKNEFGEADFNGSQLEDMLTQEETLHKMAVPTLDKVGDRPTLVFTVSVRHAHELAAVLNRYRKDSAAAVDGTTDKERRKEIVRDFAAGRVQFLCNCAVFTEGFDAPNCAAIVMGRPTKSLSLYTQMLGRGLRPLPGIVDGVEDAFDRTTGIFTSDKPNCIAEGQRVLTDWGLVPIERVTTDMKVWDGVEYVRHCGTILRGVRPVVTYAGLTATEDHHVWTKDGWRTFGECARRGLAIIATGNGGVPVPESEGCFRRGDPARQEGYAAPLGRVCDLRNAGGQGPQQSAGSQGRVPEVRQPSDRTQVAPDACGIGQAAMYEPEGLGLGSLRRAGDSVRLPVAGRNGGVGSGEPRAAEGFGTGPDRQRRALRAGQPPIPDPQSEPVEHAPAAGERRDARLPPDTPARPVRGRDAEETPPVRPDVAGDHRPARGEVQQAERRVWDIVGAGPRHRFTAEGLLVHNCLVIDFVGNSNHKLASCYDVLGGNYDAETRELAKREAVRQPRDVGDAMEQAASLLALERLWKEREHITAAAAHYSAYKVNPFDADAPEVAGSAYTGPARGTASDSQVRLLVNLGVAPATAEGYSKRQAGAVIDSLAATRCTTKQAGVLRKAGIDPAGIGMDRASRIIDALAKNGWRRPEVMPE